MSEIYNKDLFNSDSENIVLSILLKNPQKLYEHEPLRPEYFTSSQSRAVFQAIHDLSNQGMVPDNILVINKLKQDGTLNLVGEEYINKLVSVDYNAVNYKQYHENMVMSYIAKNMVNIGPRIENLLQQNVDIYSILSEAGSKISELISRGSTDKTKRNSELSADYIRDFENRITNPKSRFITSGFESIDQVAGGLLPGDVWVFAGRASAGKSAWAVNSMVNTAKAGFGCLYFSREMNWNSLWDRMVSIESGIPLTKIRQGLVNKSDGEYERFYQTAKSLSGLPIILDDNFGGSIDYITSVIRKFRYRDNIKSVYIDYIQLVSERNMDSTHELGRITKTLKAIAGELGIGIHLGSQLNRGVEHRDDKKPLMSDLRQSGNIEEDADLVGMIYRDDYYDAHSENKGKIEYIIRKNRNGPIGTLTFNFDANTTKIY